ncbi:MAG TPA: hypothetical protein VKB14_17760 [Actinomycetales bacterium]|nr:hypothetical protein [Actinomycetales bacterium]
MPKHLLVNGENYELPDETHLDELRDQLTQLMEQGLVRKVPVRVSRRESLPLVLNGKMIATCFAYETQSEKSTAL